jgi:hypothetical protein
MAEDRELQQKMLDIGGLLTDKFPSLTNLSEEFALHLAPNADMNIVVARIGSELVKHNSTVYCLSGGRSSDGKVVVIVKHRKNK